MAMMSTERRRRGRFGEKADFIRSQPHTMSAREVVEAAEKVGIKISVNHVYNLRMGATAKHAPVARLLAHHRSPSLERQIRDFIAEIGLRRARTIFEEVEAAFRGR